MRLRYFSLSSLHSCGNIAILLALLGCVMLSHLVRYICLIRKVLIFVIVLLGCLRCQIDFDSEHRYLIAHFEVNPVFEIDVDPGQVVRSWVFDSGYMSQVEVEL